MKFEHVALASIGCVLPPQIVTSEQIEARLAPVYERLRLPSGRLELASGIGERRVWLPNTRISDGSIKAGAAAIEAANINPQAIQTLIHASVCREFLEPATACRVHHHLGLSRQAWVYDVSNACLGILNGAVQIATQIEHGIISAGIVVGTENSLGLMEATIQALNSDTALTRKTIKAAFASLTIGSAACAWLLVDRRKYPGGAIGCAVSRAFTQHSELCLSNTDQTGSSMQPLMDTDSEQLLQMGIEAGGETFAALTLESGLQPSDFGSSVSHQVGHVHRRQILERVGLPIEQDYATFSWLGNTGSVALPTALAVALDLKQINSAKPTALLGIGSGINSIMLAGTFDDVAVRIVDESSTKI